MKNYKNNINIKVKKKRKEINNYIYNRNNNIYKKIIYYSKLLYN